MLEQAAPVALPLDAQKPLDATFAHYADALTSLAKAEPMLGLSGSAGSLRHFKRSHGHVLRATGACIRTSSGAWLAHREKFPQVVRALCLGLPVGAGSGNGKARAAL